MIDKITDWMGNEVKPGQKICFIRVKECFIWDSLLIPGFDSFEISKIDQNELGGNIWQVGPYMKIQENYFVTNDIGDCSVTYKLTKEMQSNEFEILAIKGISDKKELYYNQIK